MLYSIVQIQLTPTSSDTHKQQPFIRLFNMTRLLTCPMGLLFLIGPGAHESLFVD